MGLPLKILKEGIITSLKEKPVSKLNDILDGIIGSATFKLATDKEIKAEALEAIKALFLSVVGEDEEIKENTAVYMPPTYQRNKLRTELRERIKEL